MSKSGQRKTELWDHEGEIAIRIVNWFELLIKLRLAASKGVPPKDLIDQLMQASPDMLDHDFEWLMIMLQERFQLSQEQFNRLSNLKRHPKKITLSRYIRAYRESRNGSIADMARRLKPEKVSRKSLSNWLNKHPEYCLPKK